MTSLRSSHVKSITGFAASVCSTEKTTHSIPPQTTDFDKIFKQYSPLLLQGQSFALHDDIIHEILDEQSGCSMQSQVRSLYIMQLFVLCFSLLIAFCVEVSSAKICFTIFIIVQFLDLFKKVRTHFTILEPQFGLTAHRADPYLKETLQVWCLYASLRDAKTKLGMTAAIVQYLQAHVSSSLPVYLFNKAMNIDHITDWSSTDSLSNINIMLDEAFGSDSLIEEENELFILDPQGGKIAWHEAMDMAFSNWQKFRHSTIASKFTNLINIVVSAGMCSTASLSFKIGNVALFSPMVSKKQLQAGDVFEAFYEAVAGFMQGGWKVFQTGDVSAFFSENDKITEFEVCYSKIKDWHGYAITGNLEKLTVINDNEYENQLNKAILLGETLLSTIPRTSQQNVVRSFVQVRTDRMRENRTEFNQMRSRGGLRTSPFALSLFGQSGCGKSSITSLSINAGLVANGLSADKDRITTWADNDKYASTVRSDANAIIFDDFANTKEEFMDFSPAYRLIQVINNIKYVAPMADVFLKGKVSLNPYFCVISTNVEHLNAAKYSNEPESVLRRMYHVKVVPKKEFCTAGILDSDKIYARFGVCPNPDVWFLTIRQYQAQNNRHIDMKAMKPIMFEDKLMVDVSISQYLRWVQVASKEHFISQRKFLANQSDVPTLCEKCDAVYCTCNDPILEPNFGKVGMCTIADSRSYFEKKAERIQDSMSKISTSSALAADNFCLRWAQLDFMPERFICHPKVLKTCLVFWKNDIQQSLITGLSFLFGLCLCLCAQFPRLSIVWILISFPFAYWYICATVQTYQIMVHTRILEAKDVISTFISDWKIKYAILGIASVSLILMMLKHYSKLETNTGLDPQNIDEINKRNDQVDPWARVETVGLAMSAPSKTTTSSDLASAMKTNLVGIVSDQDKTTLGFYVAANFLLIPTHFATEHGKKDFRITCYKGSKGYVGSSFKDKLSFQLSVQIPDSDFTLCYVTSGGTLKNMQKFLPLTDKFPRTEAKLVTRGIVEPDLQVVRMMIHGTSRVRHTSCNFIGSLYELPIPTKPGMCMSPVISDGRGSTIIGFHLAGKGVRGGCGIVTADQMRTAICELGKINSVVLSSSSGYLAPHMGTFPTETLGCKILLNKDIHPKSATNYLKPGAHVEMYGQVQGKSTPYSSVKQTLISDSVAKIFGREQEWGAPQFRGPGRFPYQATLEPASQSSLTFGGIMVDAVTSYKLLVYDVLDRIPELFNIGPLDRVETVSGNRFMKFIDPMNFKSSPGFPLKGSKRPLLVELPAEDYPHVGKPQTFNDEIWDEYDKTVACLRSEERCYIIWKSCLKDEATKLTKDKVRVFQSAPLVLQLLIRRYFLPVVRIIQMNPILFECAVGINAEGPEWEEMWNAALSKGENRVLAGDYSKYDIRMPAQATIAAFDILIDIASKCSGYVEEDLQLMRMMVHEVVYPIMAYNGDLIQLFGTNPSGQNLTVIINSVVNSLLLRCCFLTMYPKKDFKQECAFITYGDDVIGTVSEDCDQFTHINYANYLAEHDMKFTMPDKTSEPTHYMNATEVDFLKRKCVYNADLDQKVGLLCEDSIYKRLHSHVTSKELSYNMHSAQNIESSLHDWFYYGREVFEDRKSKLQKVAQECEIEHLCPALHTSYDTRVLKWKHKYQGLVLEELETIPESLE